MTDKIPRECPKCGCDSVCCTCGWIDELRGVIEQEEDYEPPTQVTDLCEDCNERPITGLDARCDTCRENANERAYDRSMEEPTYRGSEYASALAEQQAQAKRLK